MAVAEAVRAALRMEREAEHAYWEERIRIEEQNGTACQWVEWCRTNLRHAPCAAAIRARDVDNSVT